MTQSCACGREIKLRPGKDYPSKCRTCLLDTAEKLGLTETPRPVRG